MTLDDDDRARVVTVVLDRPRGALAPFVASTPWWVETAPVVDEVRGRFGLELTVLRLLAGTNVHAGPVTYLAEVDPDQFERAERVIRPLDADEAALVDEHPLRLPWARPGGPATLLDWAGRALSAAGITLVDRPRQIRSWNLSGLWQLPTDDGLVWLKATPPPLAHESLVIAEVARATPEGEEPAVPDLVAGQPGLALMRDVPGIDGYDATAADFLGAVEVLQRVQARIDVERLVGLGVPRLGVGEYTARFDDILDRHHDELTPVERRDLATLRGEITDRFAAASVVADTLVHGDLNGGNFRLRVGRPPVLLDWGDSFVGNPLFDLAAVGQYFAGAREEIERGWRERLQIDDLAPAWSALAPLVTARGALVFRAFLDAIEPSEQIYHRDDVVAALRASLATLAAGSD